MAGHSERQSKERQVEPVAQRPSQAVVEAVASKEGVEPIEIGPLAYDIDPDALNRLVQSMDEGSITFGFEGYQVRVDSDGGVVVEPARAEVTETIAD
jgi:hypothetical protein